jgi:hypothetical protein
MRNHHTLRMMTHCARHRKYEVDAVMSPDKKGQKGNLGRRPRSFFNIFNENEQITTNTTADPSVATPASPAEIDTRPPGEKAPLANPAVTVTTDTDTTISDFDLVNQEIANSREPSGHATLASVESIAKMGFDRMDVLVCSLCSKAQRGSRCGVSCEWHPTRGKHKGQSWQQRICHAR